MQVCERDQLGCHAGHQEVDRCHTRGESQITVTLPPLPNLNEALMSPIQKSKTGVSVPQKIKSYLRLFQFSVAT